MITITSIVVATDFGEPASAALEYGRALARTFHASLHVVHVVDNIVARTAPGATFPEFMVNIADAQRGLEETGRAAVDKLLSHEDRQQLQATSAAVTSNDPAQAIVDYAESVDADLILAGTHGRRGVSRLFLGSVAERLVRHARCPVLTVRQQERADGESDAPPATAQDTRRH